MHSEIYRFNKTFDERLNEFNTILGDVEIGSSLHITRMWSDYLEMSVEPVGWKALWNVSRKCCQELKIAFPTVVVVMVENVDYTSLTADATVLEVEDVDESDKLPSKVDDIPLKELYVMLKQEYKGPNYDTTAESLDQYRFFYNHLWWPWDDDENNAEGWMCTHFLFRLTLSYDMLNGNMHIVTARTIKNLVEKGKELYYKLEGDDSISDAQEVDGDEHVLKMIDTLNELDLIKIQLSRWENTDLRRILDTDIRNRSENKKCGNQIVITECSLSEAHEYFGRLNKCATDLKILKRTTDNLKNALVHYIGGDNIFIVPGTQTVSGNEPLTYDVTIRGLYVKKPTTIVDYRSNWCLFETLADHVVFHSLTLEVKFSRNAIMVKRGVTYLNSVTIKHSGKNANFAIIVHDGASLIANNSNFIDFDGAIMCRQGATLQLIDCNFQNNTTCVTVEKGGKLLMENCDLVKTKNTPVQFKGADLHEKYESLEYLNGLENITLNNVKISDPQKTVFLV